MSKGLTIYLDEKGFYHPNRKHHIIEGVLPHTNYQWEETLAYMTIKPGGWSRSAQRVWWWSHQLQYEFSMMMKDFQHFMRNMLIEKKVVLGPEKDMDVRYTITGTWGFKMIGRNITLKRIK
ncbi:hypothetical protein KKH23_08225 [Patescibacteria group bacterium]|nr:hypothetical protein [Patescibacteria group bacterium]MBU0847162.1 hypothetical protein [Patescibacteria group bacterium]